MIQQYQMMIVDKPLKSRGKPIVTMYGIAAESREEAIELFDREVGTHHRELAMSWSCTETKCQVVRIS